VRSFVRCRVRPARRARRRPPRAHRALPTPRVPRSLRLRRPLPHPPPASATDRKGPTPAFLRCTSAIGDQILAGHFGQRNRPITGAGNHRFA
jgi:hypothetical protein